MSRKLRAADGPSWTPTEKARRERLLKQNLPLEGARGNSAQFLSGWDLAFGKQSPDEKAELEKKWREQMLANSDTGADAHER